MKDLAEVGVEELKAFLGSFDEVLCDCDGVLFLVQTMIPGANDAIQFFHSQNKPCRFISNNCTMTLSLFNERLNKMSIKSSEEDIVYPTLGIIWYLKSNNFDKKIYCLGTQSMKQELKEAGFDVVRSDAFAIEENLGAVREHLVDDESIGAVVVDLDVNLTFIKLHKALLYLLRPDVLFIGGGCDRKIPFSRNYSVVGPGFYIEMLKELTGRQPCVLSKPSATLNEFVHSKFHIKDNRRVLFVGDSINDLQFAAVGGYRMLLVLSGVTKEGDLKNIPEDCKPDYYVESLGALRDIFKEKLGI